MKCQHTRYENTTTKGRPEKEEQKDNKKNLKWKKNRIQTTHALLLDSDNLSVCIKLVCPIRITQWSPTDKFISKRRRPRRAHQVEVLAEAIVMVQTTPLCVRSYQSWLSASQTIGEIGRAAAIARSRAAEKLFVKSIFKWNWVEFIFVPERHSYRRAFFPNFLKQISRNFSISHIFLFFSPKIVTNLIFLVLENFTNSDRTNASVNWYISPIISKLWKFWEKSSPIRT